MRRLRRREPVTPVQAGKAAGPIAGPQHADNYRKMLGLKLLQSFTGMEKRRLYAIAWSADGATLAATGEDGHVGLWTQATGEWRIWPGHTGTPVGLAWHPVSPLLATAANDKTVRLWQTETEQSSVLCGLASEIT